MLLYTFYPTTEKCYKNVTGAYTVSIAQWTLQRSVGCVRVCVVRSTHFMGAFGEAKGVFGWEVYIQAKMGLPVSIF